MQTVVPPRVDETPKTEIKDLMDVDVDVITKVDETSTPVQVDTETPPAAGEIFDYKMYMKQTDLYLFLFVSLLYFVNVFSLNFTPVIGSV